MGIPSPLIVCTNPIGKKVNQDHGRVAGYRVVLTTKATLTWLRNPLTFQCYDVPVEVCDVVLKP